jgi:hypothetical protein
MRPLRLLKNKMKRIFISAIAAIALCFLVGNVSAQPLITAARVDRADDQMTGAVYATVGGREIKVADAGVDSWVIQGGRKMVYSGRDGSGGFENEGMSLHIYDAQTAKTRKIMSEYFMVDTVTEVTTSTKRTALLVKLSDGGLGASYFAVVDPNRGEVFFRRWALLLSRKGDTIVLGRYREGDWDKLGQDANAKVTPYRKERYNLKALLRRRVIQNKRYE